MIFPANTDTTIISGIIQDSIPGESFGATIGDPISGELLFNTSSIIQNGGFLMQESSHTWYFYLFMLLFVTYALARALLGRLSSSAFMATIKYSLAASMYNDNSQLQRQRDNVLYVFYFISMGFFSMLCMEKWEKTVFELVDFELFIFSSGAIFILFYLRIFTLNTIGYIFDKRELFKEYLYQSYSYNKLMGIVFLPLNFVIVFTIGFIHEIAVYFSLSILIVLVVFKLFRAVVFSIKKHIFNFYLFLYLCALELVPLLLLYKCLTIIV